TNGAEGPMAQDLGLNLLQLGVVISSLIFAAAVGALVWGRVSDAWGRRRTIILLAVLFFLGTALVVLTPTPAEEGTFSLTGYTILVCGRILIGLAVGG
ncbi:MFS transporter, partial [Kocuria rosea]